MTENDQNLERYAAQKEQESTYSKLLKRPLPKIETYAIYFIAATVIISILVLYFLKINVYTQAQGILQPVDEPYRIESPGGTITQIHAKAGDELLKGSIIARLDYHEDLDVKISDELMPLVYELSESYQNDESSDIIENIDSKLDTFQSSKLGGNIRKLFEDLKIQYTNLKDLQGFQSDSFLIKQKKLLNEIELSKEKIELLKKDLILAKNNELDEKAELNRKKEFLENYKKLYKQGYYSELDLNNEEAKFREAKKQYQTVLKDISEKEIQISNEKIRLNSLKIKQEEEKNSFTKQLQNAKEKYQTALLEFVNKFDRTVIRMPFDGYIAQMKISNVGQSIPRGELVAIAVKGDSQMKLVANMKNKDIGQIKQNQEVRIKLEAYPYKDFGVISGKILNVVPNVPISENANRVQDTFQVNISLNKQYVTKGNKKIYLFPGLKADADVIIKKQPLYRLFFKNE